MEIGVMFWAELRRCRGNPVRWSIAVSSASAAKSELTRHFTAEWNFGFRWTTFVWRPWCAPIAAKATPTSRPSRRPSVSFLTRCAPSVSAAPSKSAISPRCSAHLAIGCQYIGVVPDDRTDPDYIAVRDMVRRICDPRVFARSRFRARKPGPGIRLEVLLRCFMQDAGRGNLKIEFRPREYESCTASERSDFRQQFAALAAHVVSIITPRMVIRPRRRFQRKP